MSMNVTSDTAARERALEALEGHLQLVACAGAGKTERSPGGSWRF